MTLIPLRPLMEASVKHGFAQGAFNVNAVTQAKAAIGVHETFRSAVILQGADLANGFMGGRCGFMSATLEDKGKGAKNIARTVKKYGENNPIPIALHLDHGWDFGSYAVVVAGGYTSVMIDRSSLASDENVELTREAVKYAHARGVNVEGELGVLARVEDHVFSEGLTYTNPLKAIEFLRKTGVDALAISYGTMHGASKGKDVELRKEIAVAIRECLNHEGIFGALISHGLSTAPGYTVNETSGLGSTLTGAYGIAIHELQAAARRGINKTNVDADIRLAVTRNMRGLFAGSPDKRNSSSIGGIYELLKPRREQFDPRVFLTPIMDMVMTGAIPDEDTAVITDCIEWGVKEVVGTPIVQFGSYGKAPLVEQASLEEMAECYRKM